MWELVGQPFTARWPELSSPEPRRNPEPRRQPERAVRALWIWVTREEGGEGREGAGGLVGREGGGQNDNKAQQPSGEEDQPQEKKEHEPILAATS